MVTDINNRSHDIKGRYTTEPPKGQGNPIPDIYGNGTPVEIEDEDGTSRWRDANGVLVREYGPAVVYPDGTQEWWSYNYGGPGKDSTCDSVARPASTEIRDYISDIADEIADSGFSYSVFAQSAGKEEGVEVWIDFYEVQEQCGNYMREPELRLEERSSRLFVVRRSAEDVTEQFGANTFVIYDGAYRLLDKDTGPIYIDDVPSQIREFMGRTQEELDQGINEGIYQMDAD